MNTNTSKHTPWPWNYNGFADHCDVGRKYHEITDSDGFEVINQNGIVANEHDARLIAAAPELLAALESTFAALYRARVDVYNHDRDNYAACENAIDQARAALAKAKGEK